MTDQQFVEKYIKAVEKSEQEEAEAKNNITFSAFMIAAITTPPVTL